MHCNAASITLEYFRKISPAPSFLTTSSSPLSLSAARGVKTAKLQVSGRAQCVEGAQQLGEPAHWNPLQGNVSTAVNWFLFSCCPRPTHPSRSHRIITPAHWWGGLYFIFHPPAGSVPRLLKPVCTHWSSTGLVECGAFVAPLVPTEMLFACKHAVKYPCKPVISQRVLLCDYGRDGGVESNGV